jgi:hypothetical protein
MNTPSDTVRTPSERIAAGEIVRFNEIAPSEMAALFPRFGETWLRALQSAQPVGNEKAA